MSSERNRGDVFSLVGCIMTLQHKVLKYFLILHVCGYLSVCMQTMYVQLPAESREGHQMPRTGVTSSDEARSEC